MSYHDVEPETPEGRIGMRIYMDALADRRGFREDQLGIFEAEIWEEIFEAIGREALAAVPDETLAKSART